MIRTRFAPSPTGSIHLGGLRTALYNFLFARAHDGRFILRIEDTDRTRSKKVFEQEIFEALHWIGCIPDEDAWKGGPYGPYRQSERTEFYETYFERLKKSQAVLYPCFCTQEELEELRLKQKKEGKRIGYDGRCFYRSEKEISRLMEKGKPFSYRLRLPQEKIVFHDLLKGEVSIDLMSLSDPVIKRSDGSFTYHFCVVVDDIEMKITHVIRGEDHLVNTAYHLLLYGYLGETPPNYAHVALLVDHEGKKLSKRVGGVTYKELKASGILPEAIVSYLLSAGAGKEMIFQKIEEAIENFNLQFLPKGKTFFDYSKLLDFNKKVIYSVSEERILEYLLKEKLVEIDNLSQKESVLEWLKAWKENLENLQDAAHIVRVYLSDNISYKLLDLKLARKEEIEALKELLRLSTESKGVLDLLELAQEVSASRGVSKGKIFKILRIAATGLASGPPLPVILNLLGVKKVLNRIKLYLQALGEDS